MADGISIDTSELDRFEAHIGKATTRLIENTSKALEVSARNIRDDWRAPLAGSATVPAGAYSVTFDMHAESVRGLAVGAAGIAGGVTGLRAEIGPELGRAQGPIVGLLEEGTPTVGPRGFGLAALQKNQGDFERGLAQAAEDSL